MQLSPRQTQGTQNPLQAMLPFLFATTQQNQGIPFDMNQAVRDQGTSQQALLERAALVNEGFIPQRDMSGNYMNPFAPPPRGLAKNAALNPQSFSANGQYQGYQGVGGVRPDGTMREEQTSGAPDQKTMDRTLQYILQQTGQKLQGAPTPSGGGQTRGVVTGRTESGFPFTDTPGPPPNRPLTPVGAKTATPESLLETIRRPSQSTQSLTRSQQGRGGDLLGMNGVMPFTGQVLGEPTIAPERQQAANNPQPRSVNAYSEPAPNMNRIPGTFDIPRPQQAIGAFPTTQFQPDDFNQGQVIDPRVPRGFIPQALDTFATTNQIGLENVFGWLFGGQGDLEKRAQQQRLMDLARRNAGQVDPRIFQ